MSERPRLLPALVLVGVTVFLVGLAKHRAYVSGDGWLYAAMGRDLLDHGLTHVDRFTFTAGGHAYVNRFLVATVVWAWVLEELGGFALYLLSAASGVLVLLGAGLQGRARWPVRLSAIPFALILLGVDGQFFEARAQNPAHLLFLAALALATSTRRLSPARVGAWLALAILWTNWHPSFLLVFCLPLLLAVLWRLLEPAASRPPLAPVLTFAGLGLVVAAFATPFGPDLLLSTVGLAMDATTNSIAHMRSPEPTFPWVLFTAATLLVAAARACSPRAARRHSEVALVIGFLTLTWISQRYAALSLIVTLHVWLPVADELWTAGADLGARERRAFTVLAAGAALVGALLLVRGREPYLWGPRTAVRWVDEHAPPGRVMNEFAAGGYLMWAWGPVGRVFIDGRNFLFTNGVFEDYGEVVRMGREGLALLDVYGVNTIIAKPMDELHPAFDYVKGWRLAFEGEDGVVYVREDPVDPRVIRPSDRSR